MHNKEKGLSCSIRGPPPLFRSPHGGGMLARMDMDHHAPLLAPPFSHALPSCRRMQPPSLSHPPAHLTEMSAFARVPRLASRSCVFFFSSEVALTWRTFSNGISSTACTVTLS